MREQYDLRHHQEVLKRVQNVHEERKYLNMDIDESVESLSELYNNI